MKKRTKTDIFIFDVQVKKYKEKKTIFRYFNNQSCTNLIEVRDFFKSCIKYICFDYTIEKHRRETHI